MQESSRFHTLVINERLNSQAKSGDAAFEVGDGDGCSNIHKLIWYYFGQGVKLRNQLKLGFLESSFKNCPFTNP